MTDYESFSLFVAASALVISAISAIGTRAAFVSARSAKQQAQHAETQADAAKAQANAAQDQLDLMRASMTIDRVGAALKARRTVIDLKDAIIRADGEVKRARGSREIHIALQAIHEASAKLEDLPPIFPASVRKILFGFVQQLDEVDYGNATEANGLPVQNLHRAADGVIASMSVAITESISKLKD